MYIQVGAIKCSVSKQKMHEIILKYFHIVINCISQAPSAKTRNRRFSFSHATIYRNSTLFRPPECPFFTFYECLNVEPFL